LVHFEASPLFDLPPSVILEESLARRLSEIYQFGIGPNLLYRVPKNWHHFVRLYFTKY